MKNSLKNLFGEELKQNGYKKVKVNHYQRKVGSYLIFIDNDLDRLLIRFMTTKHPLKPLKCIKNKWFDKITKISKLEFKDILEWADSELNKEVNKLNLEEYN